MPPSLSSSLLYIAAGLNGALVLGHTKMGYDLIFPNTAENAGGAAARIGWWEVNESFVTMGIFCLKWAKYGLKHDYDKAFFYFALTSQAFFGWRYVRAGLRKPAIGLWGVPLVAGLSQLV